MHDFFNYYEDNSYDSIKKRFGFSDNKSVDAMASYLKKYPKELIYFEKDGGSIEAAQF